MTPNIMKSQRFRDKTRDANDICGALASSSPSVYLVDQGCAVTSGLHWHFVFERVARVLTCETKAHATRKVVDLIECVPPAYRVAYGFCAFLDLRPVVVVIPRAKVYTSIGTLYNLANGVLDARISERDATFFAECHLGVVYSDII
jgi:hypothetical protein